MALFLMERWGESFKCGRVGDDQRAKKKKKKTCERKPR